jgi:hypothetical protein
MFDQTQLKNKQIGDFLNEHKSRFNAVTQQGKSGYSTILSKPENTTLFM